MIEKDIMSEEAFNEIVEGFELVEKLTPYGRKNLKYHIKRLQQENQELKNQLENQRKEFIEYLEDYIEVLKSQQDSVEGLDLAEEHMLMTLEEVLEKYKGIIGGSNENNSI